MSDKHFEYLLIQCENVINQLQSSNVLGHIKESLINADKQQLTDVNNS